MLAHVLQKFNLDKMLMLYFWLCLHSHPQKSQLEGISIKLYNKGNYQIINILHSVFVFASHYKNGKFRDLVNSINVHSLQMANSDTGFLAIIDVGV